MPSRARIVYFLVSVLSLGSELSLFRNVSGILKANGNIHEQCKIKPDVSTHLLIKRNIFSKYCFMSMVCTGLSPSKGVSLILQKSTPREEEKNLPPGVVYQTFRSSFRTCFLRVHPNLKHLATAGRFTLTFFFFF